jgi:hypothetical protein
MAQPILCQDAIRINHPHGRRYHALMLFGGKHRTSDKYFDDRVDAQCYGIALVKRYRRLAAAAGGGKK